MRQILAIVLATLMLAPELPARANHDWAAVRNLTPDIPVNMRLWDGEKLRGYIISVNDSGLQFDEGGWRPRGQSNQFRDIDREAIQKIVRMPEPPHLPDPQKWMAIGALAGAGVGVTIGGIGDAKHGNNGRGLVDGLAGGLFGFFGSVVVLGVIGTGATAKMVAHHKVIYEAAGPPPSQLHK